MSVRNVLRFIQAFCVFAIIGTFGMMVTAQIAMLNNADVNAPVYLVGWITGSVLFGLPAAAATWRMSK